jgi:cephalosporin hydroxylase/glycosyltransferase involved in cell wall biosynthesis
MTRSEEVASGVPEGNVDGFVDGALRGWAWFPEDPECEAVIEIVANEAMVATVAANEFRQDLRAAGKRDGACGFSVRFSDKSLVGQPVTVRVRLGDDVFELPGSPVPGEIDHDAGALSLLPIALNAPGIAGYLDLCGQGKLRGWAIRTDDKPEAVQLALFENGAELLLASAHKWRNDLAEMRQGNGSCGFDAVLPEEHCDGMLHEYDIRDAETGRSLLARPVRMLMEPPPARALGKTLASHHVPALRRTVESDLRLSVVVIFYNMQREAARTLTSLTRAYQQGIGDLAYEVLCVDNGSEVPLDADWIAAFGPEFRLLRPEHPHPSPCSAINDAVRQARGEHVAIMIDGAHVLTPGVFREAMEAIEADPTAVVAIRHWFIGGDQRWLSAVGYTRGQEDQLFARIHWPSDGYQLFHIGAPIGEQTEPWLVGMIESNCLFLPTDFYCEIGGMDEAFSEPGAGFANLDLFQRAGLASPNGMVALIGEATFHQFHGGTTTNVSDDVKDQRVRAYARTYTTLRGEDFEGIPADRIRLRGIIRDKSSIGVRERSLLPMKLGVTPLVRPGMLEQHYDEDARLYLQSAYAESGLHKTSTWRGVPLALAPADMVNLQEMLHAQRPEHLITTSNDPGLHAFLDSVLVSLGLDHTRITGVLAQGASLPQTAARSQFIASDGDRVRLAADLEARVADAESIVVVLSPSSGDMNELVPELQFYSSFVSYRSYLVVLGTAFGQPWLGYSSNWYLAAIRRFVAASPFVIDTSMDRHWITTSPSGYLRKVAGNAPVSAYDSALDDLDAF